MAGAGDGPSATAIARMIRANRVADTGKTLVSARRVQELEERRSAMSRLALVSVIAWPMFLVPDLLAAFTTGHRDAVAIICAVRAIGWVTLIAGYFVLKRVEELSPAWLTTLDVGGTAVLGTIVAIAGVTVGGLNSPLGIDVLAIAFIRATLLPSHWTRALGVASVAAFAWPVVMGAAAFFVPFIRAQWGSSADLGAFAHDFIVTLGSIAIGSTGSHLAWASRRQVLEARKLGNYRLKARIGGGGSGDVWLARQDPLGRSVALKVLKERGASDDESIRRFEREARAASQLKHPNTIRIFDFGASDDGVLYIAMELLEGLDLDTLVELSGPLPLERVIHLARQACGSLAEAHDAGIIHRDIKPANLFVTHAGDDEDFLKLLDFGVARLAETPSGASSLTESGILFGTPAYMSPEVCSGEPADARSDIYSLGAVLYYMLTGTPLFPNRSFGDTVMSHVSKVPDRPSMRLGAPVPADLEAVIMRCLEKWRDARFTNVRALDAELAACADAGKWTREDAQAFWRNARSSLQLRARTSSR
jgi:eukaryotic-like serine/threonine-protein kinase